MVAAPPDLEAEIDRLYAGPLAGFVGERKALAARLRSGGDRDAARRVAGLPRPSATAWAVNQLFWHERALFDALRRSGSRVRSAHEGDAAAGALPDALAERRRALADATRAALARLVAAGHGAGLAAERRIRGSLEAMAAGADAAAGRLQADLAPPSFDAISGLTPALAPRPAESPTGPEAGAPERSAERDDARRLAEAECARLERRVARAEEGERAVLVRAQAARAEISEAEQRLERARSRSAEAAAELERCRDESAAARDALARAREELEAARRDTGDQ